MNWCVPLGRTFSGFEFCKVFLSECIILCAFKDVLVIICPVNEIELSILLFYLWYFRSFFLLICIVIIGKCYTYRSRARLESELPPQQVQRSAQCWRASWGGEVDCDSLRGKGLWQHRLKKYIYYSYFLTCSVDSFGFFLFLFPFCPPSVVDFIGTKKSN